MGVTDSNEKRMKVGLVLGAGGVMGGAWLTGGLAALAEATGWDPQSADRIVGTSAGAMIGSLVAAGVPPWFMVAHSAGEVFDGLLDASGAPVADADRSAGAVFRLAGPWLPVPGSPRLALDALRGRAVTGIRGRLAAMAPAGVISTEPLKETVRRAVPTGWAGHPGLWIVACDYGTGQRVVFGRPGAPPAELADAVAASCAIPGFYRPVRIGGRRYVDGGTRSLASLDLLEGAGLDLVVVFSPLSSRAGGSRIGRWPHQRLLGALRTAAARELDAAAARLRRQGTRVVVFEPGAADLEVMGANFMSTRRRHQVIERALKTVSLTARRRQAQLSGLPVGEPDRTARPSGPPAEWSWRPGEKVEAR